jgi:hypothetical protein
LTTPKRSAANPAASTISSELDAAFAMVQSATTQQSSGQNNSRKLALDYVKKTEGRVNEALADASRGEAEKRLLEAKLRALIGAAARIPAA